MADPLSIAKSVMSVAELSFKIFSYISGVVEGYEERKSLAQELQMVEDILRRLSSKVEKDKQNPSDSTKAFQQHIEGLKQLLEELWHKLGGESTVSSQRASSAVDPSILNKNRTMRSLLWPFTKEEVLVKLDAIERYKSYFTIVLVLVDGNGEQKQAIQRIEQDLATLNARMAGPQAPHIHLQLPADAQGHKILENELMKSALQWISPLEFSVKHADINGRRTTNTGSQLLENSSFKQWVTGTSGSNLLCTGIPGAGKTFLASLVISHLQETYKHENVGICYVYCSYKDQDRQSSENLVSSLVRHLATDYENETFSTRLIDIHQTYQKKNECEDAKLSNAREVRPSLAEYSNLLREFIPIFKRVFIVVDALDECLREERDRFIVTVQKLNASVMFTSRPLPEITEFLQNKTEIEVRAHDEDIRRFLENGIAEKSSLATKDQGLVTEIIEKIIAKAEGMFLLAHLHLEAVALLLTTEEVRRALDNLPTRPIETYDKAIQIISQREETKQLARKALIWLCYSTRPLSFKELQYAVSWREGQGMPTADALYSKEDILSASIGLFTYDSIAKRVRLVHYTTQEYFVSQGLGKLGLTEAEAHGEIAIQCISHFSNNPPSSWDKIEFHTYASENWTFHAQQGSTDNLSASLRKFLVKKNLVYKALWDQMRWDEADCTPFLVAAAFGFMDVLESELRAGSNLKQKTCNEQHSALALAASYGQKEVVVRLLKCASPPLPTQEDSKLEDGKPHRKYKGIWGSFVRVAGKALGLGALAIIDAKDSDGETPLMHAIENGHIDIVKLLLENGASPSTAGVYGHTPLFLAAGYERFTVAKDMINLLLTHGASVNGSWTTLDPENSPLFSVTRRAATPEDTSDDDTLEMVRFLLNAGADPNWNLKTDAYDSLLATALINDEKSDNTHLTALQYALVSHRQRGYAGALSRSVQEPTDLVHLLLQHGYIINKPNKSGWTALHCAAEVWYPETVRLLLDKGALVDVRTFSYQSTPLHVCLKSQVLGKFSEKRKEVVKVLLQSGASVQARDIKSRNPLFYAIQQGPGDTELISILLDAGASVHMPVSERDGLTPLNHAIGCRMNEIVVLLLERGADPNEQHQKTGQTALHYAIESMLQSYYRDAGEVVRIVETLLEKGAQPDIVDKKGRTALNYAIQLIDPMEVREREKRIPVIITLLERGAKPDIADKKGRTALHSALKLTCSRAWCKESEILIRLVETLLEKGAKPDIADKKGRTPRDLVTNADEGVVPPRILELLSSQNSQTTSLRQRVEGDEAT